MENTAPEKKQQQKEIEEEMNKQISDKCFLVSMEWWKSWRRFVETADCPPPGPIDNSKLVKLCEEYQRSYEEMGDLKELSSFDNWCKMSLRKDLIENTHFQVLNLKSWLKFNNWYGGGPTIRICVVGKENANPKYKIGYPDFDPIVLRIELSHNNPANKQIKGILFSEKATCEKLFSYLGEISNINPFNMRVQVHPIEKGAYYKLERTSQTLKELLVTDNKKLTIIDTVDTLSTTADRKWSSPNKNSHFSFQTDTVMTEEEMIKLAIKQSQEEKMKEDLNDFVWVNKEDASKASAPPLYETYQVQLSSSLSPDSDLQTDFQTVLATTSKSLPSLSLNSKSLSSILSTMEKIEASFK